MPYKSKEKLKEAQHRWYLAHRDLTYARAREWKKKRREEKNRRRAREYYHKHKDEIAAKYQAQKKMLIDVPIDSNYVSPRLEALIKEFGEQDARWYETIRIGVLKGISTTKLNQPEHDKWWSMLKKRAKDIGDQIYAPHRSGWKQEEEPYDKPTNNPELGTTNEIGELSEEHPECSQLCEARAEQSISDSEPQDFE